MTQTHPALTLLELAELERLAKAAKFASSPSWIAGKIRPDATAQVYSPSLGMLRKVVPVAESTPPFSDFIAKFDPATVLALLSVAREHARLVSALTYLDSCGASLKFNLKPEDVFGVAAELGWTPEEKP